MQVGAPRERRLPAAVGLLIAAGVAALVGVMVVHRQVRPVALRAAPLALVDLQPESAEDSLKPIDWKANKLAAVHSSQRFSACVDSAATVDEGVWCMGQLLSVLPRPLEKRALEVAKEVYPSKHVVGDPKILAMKLESCVAHATERDGAVFCVSDLLSHVPPAVVNKAVELAEEHPAFDWEDGHVAAVHDAAVFNTCVDTARNVEEGVKCLGTLLTELPEAMVERSVRITSELPPPHQPAEEPQMLSKDFVYCLEIAEKRDAAEYCLAHFLGRLPDEQVHESYEYAKSHRDRGKPFLTEYQQENEDFIQDKKEPEFSGSLSLPGLGFGVGAREELSGAETAADDTEKASEGDSAEAKEPRQGEVAADDKLEHDWEKWKEVRATRKAARSKLAAAKLAKHHAAKQ